MEREQAIRSLLDWLDRGPGLNGGRWHGWQVRRITGGRNNLLYRATTPACDVAVKFTMDDGRDRAGHEFDALTVLHRTGLDVSPEPVLLDRTSYRQPVVVQAWLVGEESGLPATDEEWEGVARHLAQVHAVTPGRACMDLPPCAIDARTAAQAKARVSEQVALLPETVQWQELRDMVHRIEEMSYPEWDKSPVALCRLDNNVDNYIRRPGVWASVDWEYSGWGDPAFDVANLVTHVAWMNVAPARWDRFVGSYCAFVDDDTAPVRIGVYREILITWWAARLARYLHEIPNGQDRRLIEWPAGWQADIEAKYAHYVALARNHG